MAGISLSTIGSVVADVLKPLQGAIASPQAFDDFFATLGWKLPATTERLTTSLTTLGQKLEALYTAVEAVENVPAADRNKFATMLGLWATLGESVGETFEAIYDLAEAIKDRGVGPDTAAFAAYWVANDGAKAKELLRRLLDYLVVSHAESHHPAVYPVLAFFGLVDKVNYTPAADDTTYGVPTQQLRIAYWDRLGWFFSQQHSFMGLYHWNGICEHTPPCAAPIQFEMAQFFTAIHAIFAAVGHNPTLYALTPEGEAGFLGTPAPPAGAEAMPEMAIPLFSLTHGTVRAPVVTDEGTLTAAPGSDPFTDWEPAPGTGSDDSGDATAAPNPAPADDGGVNLSGDLEVGTVLVGLRPSAATAVDAGFGLIPYINGGGQARFRLLQCQPLFLELDADLYARGGVGLFFRPGNVDLRQGITQQPAPDPSHPPLPDAVQGRAGIGLHFGPRPRGKITLLGLPGGSCFEMREIFARGGLAASTSSPQPEGFFEVGILGGSIIISMKSADGFISQIFKDDIRCDFDLTAGYSPTRGIYFQGSASLEISLALNIEIIPNVLTLQTLHIKLGLAGSASSTSAQAGQVTLELSIDAGAKIGPVSASVERLGITGTLSLADGTTASTSGSGTTSGDGSTSSASSTTISATATTTGTTTSIAGSTSGAADSGGMHVKIGSKDLLLKFKPPNGFGAAIENAGPVSGGGFVAYDEDAGRYSGVLAIEACGLSITAIGVLDTKLPDGQEGYSFVLLVSIIFATPIQLGYGFTLSGVGGMAGINRGFLPDAVKAKIRDGSVDELLFPVNPVANAPAIIADLGNFFPPQDGRYVFGPALRIGYEVFLALEVGVYIELPEPIRITLLGKIQVALPTTVTPNPVIDLHLDFEGILDFNQKRFTLAGTLANSHITEFPIDGDLFVLLTWDSNPTFGFSFGGFHSGFPVPPGFPTDMKRLSISLGNMQNPRVNLTAYFAITSNSLQFGAEADFSFTAGSFAIAGNFQFDALFIFSPFSMSVDFSADFSLRWNGNVVCSLHIDAHIAGPGPWHAWGSAGYSFGGFMNGSISFDHFFDQTQPQSVPPRDPWTELAGALADTQSWKPVAAQDAAPAVTLRDMRPAPAAGAGAPPALIDPLGGVELHQKAVPLNLKIQLYDGVKPTADNQFQLRAYDAANASAGAVTIGGSPVAYQITTDLFAPGAFEDLDAKTKLSAPAFTAMDCGVSIDSDALASGAVVAAPDLPDETIIIDAMDAKGRQPAAPFVLSALPFLSLQPRALAGAGTRKFAPPVGSTAVGVAPVLYVIASRTSLAHQPALGAPASLLLALKALGAHLALHPEDKNGLQIVPAHEALKLAA